MYRSPKEQCVTLAEQQLLSSAVEEAAVMTSMDGAGGEWSAAYTSVSEQLKRNPRKSSR